MAGTPAGAARGVPVAGVLDLRFPHGVTVTLLTEARDNRTGISTLVEVGTLSGCALAPVTQASTSSTVDDTHLQVTSMRTLYAPSGCGIRSGQRVRLPDTTVWEAVADAGSWSSPWTGWTPGDQVELKRVTPP